MSIHFVDVGRGLTESIAMIADAMGWTLDRITDDIQPKIASVTIASEFLAVDPGYVCGIVQDGIGYRDGVPVITLAGEMARAAADPVSRRTPAADRGAATS